MTHLSRQKHGVVYFLLMSTIDQTQRAPQAISNSYCSMSAGRGSILRRKERLEGCRLVSAAETSLYRSGFVGERPRTASTSFLHHHDAANASLSKIVFLGQ